MSCACEHKKMASEYERMHRLAKMTAKLHEKTVVLYKNVDGTYGFTTEVETDKTIVEYISPY
ncbi:hypothetical protein ED388_04775 [Muribaculaceae bacterium Isolate-007 (NCI)]|nr:hypothetical protein EEL42_03510 [Muribaculaceae bacterium Isolate-100 (HZI)]RXE66300.1 hypothetical protein ED388_04775 [Muribaculaceae bacterium Isolate-007 (NCI)]